MKSKVLILDTRYLPLFTAAYYVKGSNTDYNFISNFDKDTGLTVIPVAIVSNQTVHERNIAF